MGSTVKFAAAAALGLTIASWLATSLCERIGAARIGAAREVGLAVAAQKVAGLHNQWRQTLDRADLLRRMQAEWMLARRRGDEQAARAIDAMIELQTASAASNGFAGIAVIAPDGRILLSHPDTMTTQADFGQRDSFLAIARRGQEHAIGVVARGPGGDEAAIDFASAVRDPNGGLLGVAIATLSATGTSPFVHAASLEAHDTYAIWRGDGVLLASYPVVSDPPQVVPPSVGDFAPGGEANGGVATLRFTSGTDRRGKLAALLAYPGGWMVVAVDEERFVGAVQAGIRQMRRATQFALALLAVCAFAAERWLRQWRLTRTVQRRADAMQRDLALFREMHDRMGDTFLKLNGDMIVEYVSDNIGQLLSRPAAALIGTRITACIDTSGQPDAASRYAERFANREERTECRLLAADGSHRWVESLNTYVDGRCYSVLRDVTDRHNAQQAAASAQNLLELAALTGPGVVCSSIIDLRTDLHRYTYMSPMVEQLTGYTVAEACAGYFITNHCDPMHRNRMLDAHRAMSAGQPTTLELRFRHKSGRMIWLHCEWRPRLDQDADVMVVAGYLLDVTERKQQEARAMQAAKMATVGTVAASLAYELNQPLAVISFAAENAALALAEAGGIPSAMKRLERIRFQVERAASLVQQIRVFGGGEAGSSGAIDLAAAMEGVLRLIGHRLRGAGVRVDCDWPDNLPAPLGNVAILEQVLANVLINACEAYERQANDDGVRVVTIDARVGARMDPAPVEAGLADPAANGDTWVTITVTDRAGGIDPALSERIFEPFFSTKPAISGVGLGLSYCYGAMVGMGGSIAFVHADGGAAFTLTMPAVSVRWAGVSAMEDIKPPNGRLGISVM